MTPGLLTPELSYLALTVILTGVLWIPYIINRAQIRGLPDTLDNPRRDAKPHSPWATRLMFAHDNAVENLALFAPLILILNAMDYSSAWTRLAALIYFLSRIAHVIVYTLGLPGFRTAAFVASFLALAVLAAEILRAGLTLQIF